MPKLVKRNSAYLLMDVRLSQTNELMLACGDALEVTQLLAGKRLKVTENQSFKFQRFNKDRKKLEGEFDLKPVSLFEELA